ncbi:hypothetical protein B484DRAFT_451702 [Ochromonadaceae sp. CCMP2298]|nr:hypothetical protein B484DRAFT_451702 [Ochromonadaceae sp. CCMP2298]
MRFKGDLRSRSKELSRAWTESGDSLPTISLYRTDSEVNSSTKLLGDFGEYGDDDVFGLGRGRSEEGVGEEREGKEGREGGDGEGSEGEGGVRPHSYHAHMSLLRTFTSGTGSEGSDRDRFGYGGGDGDEGDEGGEVDEGEHHPRLREQQQQTLGAGSRPMFIPHQGPRSDNRDRDRDRETRESRDSRGNRDSVSLNDMFGSPRSGDRLDHFFAAAALQARSSISQQRGSEGQSRSRVQSESQGQGQGQGDSGGSGGPRLVDGGDVMVDDSLEGGS